MIRFFTTVCVAAAMLFSASAASLTPKSEVTLSGTNLPGTPVATINGKTPAAAPAKAKKPAKKTVRKAAGEPASEFAQSLCGHYKAANFSYRLGNEAPAFLSADIESAGGDDIYLTFEQYTYAKLLGHVDAENYTVTFNCDDNAQLYQLGEDSWIRLAVLDGDLNGLDGITASIYDGGYIHFGADILCLRNDSGYYTALQNLILEKSEPVAPLEEFVYNDLEWKYYGMATFHERLMSEGFGIYTTTTQEVECYRNISNPNEILLKNPYQGVWQEYGNENYDREGYIIFDITDPRCVVMRPKTYSGLSLTGVFDEDRDFYIFNHEGYLYYQGASYEDLKRNMSNLSTFNPATATVTLRNGNFSSESSLDGYYYWTHTDNSIGTVQLPEAFRQEVDPDYMYVMGNIPCSEFYQQYWLYPTSENSKIYESTIPVPANEAAYMWDRNNFKIYAKYQNEFAYVVSPEEGDCELQFENGVFQTGYVQNNESGLGGRWYADQYEACQYKISVNIEDKTIKIERLAAPDVVRNGVITFSSSNPETVKYGEESTIVLEYDPRVFENDEVYALAENAEILSEEYEAGKYILKLKPTNPKGDVRVYATSLIIAYYGIKYEREFPISTEAIFETMPETVYLSYRSYDDDDELQERFAMTQVEEGVYQYKLDIKTQDSFIKFFVPTADGEQEWGSNEWWETYWWNQNYFGFRPVYLNDGTLIYDVTMAQQLSEEKYVEVNYFSPKNYRGPLTVTLNLNDFTVKFQPEQYLRVDADNLTMNAYSDENYVAKTNTQIWNWENVIFTSSDENVAVATLNSVWFNGIENIIEFNVRAVNAGEADITIALADNTDVFTTVHVTVTAFEPVLTFETEEFRLNPWSSKEFKFNTNFNIDRFYPRFESADWSVAHVDDCYFFEEKDGVYKNILRISSDEEGETDIEMIFDEHPELNRTLHVVVEKINPTSVTITPSVVTIRQGEFAKFKVHTTPNEWFDYCFNWDGNWPNCFDFNEGEEGNGRYREFIFLGESEGTRVGTLMIEGLEYDQLPTITVNVLPREAVVADHVVYTTHYIGDSSRLTLNEHSDGSPVEVTWTSSNPEVANVKADGSVSMVGSGEAVITGNCGTHTVMHGIYVERAVNVEEYAARNFTVYTLGKAIMVNGLESGDQVSVYSSDGALTMTRKADGYQMRLPIEDKGAYIVKIGEESYKVVL